MKFRNLCLSGLTAAAVLIATHAASAAILAQYDFEEFTTDTSTWPANNGPYVSAASSSLATATQLSNVGLGALEALSVRDASHGDLDSYALLIGPGNIASSPPDANGDYLGFSVTANGPLAFTDFSFDLGVSNSDDNTTLGHEASAQLFYSIDGGTTFVGIGAQQDRATPPGPDDVFTGMINSNIDLSGLALLPGQTAEFRLAIRNNRGYGTTAGGVYVDNLVIDGVIPEPSSIVLLCLAGAGLLVRRRR